jgi:cytochrome c oxidase assembly protein subunit 15
MIGRVPSASPLRLPRALATAGAALVLVVVVSSAYLRLSQAGLSCADWPACYGRVAQIASATTAQHAARLAHRFAASAVLFVLLALIAVSLARRPRLRRQAALAFAGLLVAGTLGVIGAVSSEATRLVPLPAVTIANLGGGFALLALLWLLRETTLPRYSGYAPAAAAIADIEESPKTPVPRWLRWLAVSTLVVAIAQMILGALVSAKFAGLACPGVPLCGADVSLPAFRAAVDPLVPLDVDASRTIVRPASLASLHFAHRIGAHVVLVLAAALVVALVRARRRREAAVVGSIVAAQLALGATSVLAGLPLPVVLAHNLVAALLLATLVTTAYRLHAVAEARRTENASNAGAIPAHHGSVMNEGAPSSHSAGSAHPSRRNSCST